MEINSIIKLREKEKEISQEVISLIKRANPDNQAIYLPNAEPKQKVDYIFITMEPSFGKWAVTEENARDMIQKGFRNFLWSIEDFLFHFSIYHYLSHNYYITDISKVASKVEVFTKSASVKREMIYELWPEYLREEIRVLGNDNSSIFLVGKTVDKWVRNNQVCIVDNDRIAGKILHYSPQARKYRKDARRKSEEAYKEFLMKEKLTEERETPFLSESNKELIYTYYNQFTHLPPLCDNPLTISQI